MWLLEKLPNAVLAAEAAAALKASVSQPSCEGVVNLLPTFDERFERSSVRKCSIFVVPGCSL